MFTLVVDFRLARWTPAPACCSPHVTHMQDQMGSPANFKEVWNVQIFRSIDSSSAPGLPRTKQALKMGLSAQKGNIVDFSIQASRLAL